MTAVGGNLWMTLGDEQATRARGMPQDWPGAENSRFVRAAGITWHVQQHGDSGPVMLLLHGAGASLHSWADMRPYAASAFRVLAIDLPGHGFSEAFASGAYTIGRTANGVVDLLEALSVMPEILVGHSAGAAIAMQMCVDGRIGSAETSRIVAINPAVQPFTGLAGIAFPALAKIAAGSSLLAGLIAARASDEAKVKRLIAGTGSHIPEDGIRRYQFLMRRSGHVAAVLSMMAGWQLDHLLPRVQQMNPPMHFVIGDLDRAVPPRRSVDVAARLSHTHVTRFADIGHLAHEEAPEQVFRTIVESLPGRLGGRG